MSCINILKNVLQKTGNTFLTAPTVLVEQTRNTLILKRKNTIPLYRKNTNPARFKPKHYVYELVENTNLKKRKPIDIILTSYVQGKGEKGDKLTISPFVAYNSFLLPGLAVYATPENIEKYTLSTEDKAKTAWSSPYAARAIDYLSRLILSITMSYEVPWTVQPWHVRMTFRKAGIYLNDDCITMPERPISGPNPEIENKEFYITVTINKRESTKVRCRIHHWSNDPLNQVKSVPEFYKTLSEPIYPEDKPILDALPIPYRVQRAMEAKSSE